ncbi:MAG: TetR/AcrR family transcriptional regulator [Motilibacteraceae bacterium]
MTRAGVDRERVLATAAQLVDRDGLRALTVSAVARELGVRPPSLYSHVAGADELRAGVTAIALSELADRVDRALAGLAGADALAALAGAHRAYARQHPGRYAAAGAIGPSADGEVLEAGQRHAGQLLAVLRGYAVPPDEQVHAVRLVASVLRGFVELEAGAAFSGSEPPVDESWPWILDRLDRLLGSWRGPAAQA